MMFPKLFLIISNVSTGGNPKSNARTKAAENRTKKGCSLVIDVPRTIQRMVIRIQSSENIMDG
jgi:hypothetical protein